MFQTISSFLPPVLQLGNDKSSSAAPDISKAQETPQADPATMQRAGDEQEQAVMGRKERKNEVNTQLIRCLTQARSACLYWYGKDGRVGR